jgi:DNA-binding NtrC family response regulator
MPTDGARPLADRQWDIIAEELERQGGNITATCRILKIARSTFYAKRDARAILQAHENRAHENASRVVDK